MVAYDRVVELCFHGKDDSKKIASLKNPVQVHRLGVFDSLFPN